MSGLTVEMLAKQAEIQRQEEMMRQEMMRQQAMELRCGQFVQVIYICGVQSVTFIIVVTIFTIYKYTLTMLALVRVDSC